MTYIWLSRSGDLLNAKVGHGDLIYAEHCYGNILNAKVGHGDLFMVK